MPKTGKNGDSLFSTTKEIRGWSIRKLSGIYLPLGQNLRRYIAAQFLTRPANAKNPANLTACGGSWSWQCDSNTRPADYEPDSGVKTKTKQVFLALLQRLNHQVRLVSRVPLHAYFPVWVRAWVNGEKERVSYISIFVQQ